MATIFNKIIKYTVFLIIYFCYSQAFAFTLLGVKWSAKTATFEINTSEGPSGSLTAFQNALNTWTAVSFSSFVFTYGGTTTSHAFGANDGINITDFGSLGVGKLGFAKYWYDGSNLTDADVRLNSAYSWSTNNAPNTFDVEIVALHEYGHALGLNHSANPSAIMYPIITVKDLHQDDIDGIRALYPCDTGCTVLAAPKIHVADLDNANQDDLVYIDTFGFVYYSTDLKNWTSIGTNKFTSVISGDFNADGNENDLAGINLNQYVVYTTDLSSWTKSGSNKFSSLIAADFDADGTKDDLAGINLNKYAVYTTDINSAWTKSGANKFTSLISADLTASGAEKDLVGINLNKYAVYTTDINSDWTKSGANKFKSIISCDFDGDGNKDDLSGINLNQYVVYTVDITGAWTRIGLDSFTSVVCGDFDGDGAEDDLAAVNLAENVLYTTDLSSWQTITKP